MTETVKFTPTEAGPASADWPINGKDTTGLHDVQFNGTGIVPETKPPAGKPLVQPILGSLGGPVVPAPETKTPPFLGAQLVATALTAGASGTVGVKLSCPAGESSCAGTITLRTRIAAGAAGAHSKATKLTSVTLAKGSFTVTGGGVSTVRLRLSSKVRALLARTHVLRVQATVTSHDPAGATYTAQVSITIRVSKKPLVRKAKRAG